MDVGACLPIGGNGLLIPASGPLPMARFVPNQQNLRPTQDHALASARGTTSLRGLVGAARPPCGVHIDQAMISGTAAVLAAHTGPAA
jgi:hypothetical protein